MPLRVLTWNVNFRAGATLDRLLELAAIHDVLALQEVTVEHASEYRRRLEDAGFHLTHDAAHGRYASMVAARLPCSANPASPALWPELSAHAVLGSGEATLHVLSVHVPNGSGNGWRKIEWLDGLHRVLDEIDGFVIVAGDFNEPRFTWLQDDAVITWGQEQGVDGRYSAHSDADAAWDTAVRWFFGPQRLRHAYWEAHGKVELPETHVSGGVSRCFDHVLVSPGLQIVSCDSVDRTRPDYSDHTAVSVSLVAPV